MFLKAALAIIVVMALYGVWMKFEINSLKLEVEVASKERDAAVNSQKSLEAEIVLNATQVREFQEKIVVIEAERAEAQKQVTYMRGLFQDHDFARLITKKPGLIEKRMIAATEKVLNELEAVTQ